MKRLLSLLLILLVMLAFAACSGDRAQPAQQLCGAYVSSCGFGAFSAGTEEADSGGKNVASAYRFLQEHREIELDKEIPVAVLAYSFFDEGTSMRSFGPDDCFRPSVFEGMDLVRAVTLVFAGKEEAPAPGR